MNTMMTLRNGLLTTAFLILVTVISCKKSSDDSSKSKTTLVTQSSWKLQSVGLDFDKNGTVDYDATSSVPACNQDEIYTFKTDFSGIVDAGATKCSGTDPQTAPFTWSFKNNETILSASSSNNVLNGNGNISTLNDANFVIWRDTVYLSQPARIYVTLKH